MSAPPACFLCCCATPRIAQTLSHAELVAVWRLAGATFSPEALGKLNSAESIHLYVCSNCGFHYFDPVFEGNKKFYEEWTLANAGYYALNRPENERNAKFAFGKGYRTMLDVGCGSGHALNAAKAVGLETYGVELTESAADAARNNGHTVFSTLLEDLDETWNGRFDIISMNQLLEHVADPLGLVRQCLRLLSPSGTLSLAVPAVNNVLRWHPWLSSNWPPHHLSRWRYQDFATVAQECGLQILQMGGDPLLGPALRNILLGHREHCRVLKKAYNGPPPWLIRGAEFIYRKAGLKHFFRSHGASIYCLLQRADTTQPSP